MLVQDQSLRARVREVVLAAEDPLALRVQQALADEFRDGAAGRKGWVEADPRVGPLRTGIELLLNVGSDPTVSGLDETRGEGAVVSDHLVVQGKDVHRSPSRRRR